MARARNDVGQLVERLDLIGHDTPHGRGLLGGFLRQDHGIAPQFLTRCLKLALDLPRKAAHFGGRSLKPRGRLAENIFNVAIRLFVGGAQERRGAFPLAAERLADSAELALDHSGGRL